MGKTLILSQAQLDEVLGANSAYLDAADISDIREYPGNEISAETNTSDGDGKPTVGDKIAGVLAKTDVMTGHPTGTGDGYNKGIPSLYCSKIHKKKVLESNSELEHRIFDVPPTVLEKLKEIYLSSNAPEDAEGRMALKGIINKGELEYSQATSIKSKLDNAKEDSSEYKELGGKVMLDFLNMILGNATEMIRQEKESKKEKGISNAFQKPGGTKNSGNGKAHTPKNIYNNGIILR